MFGKERVRFLTRKGMQRCSHLCQWALTIKRTLSGGGALEIGDLRLLEDCSERGGALVSDAIARDTARDGRGHSERAQVRAGAGTTANTGLSAGGLLEGQHTPKSIRLPATPS